MVKRRFRLSKRADLYLAWLEALEQLKARLPRSGKKADALDADP